MNRTDVTPPSDLILRYSLRERIIHWAVALLFVYLMLTGLALFSPHLFWLATVLGGGTTVARWHPMVGIVFSAVLAAMFLQWRRDMRFDAADRQWMKHIGQYIRNEDAGLPETGRFNAGQKLLFWLQVITGLLLLLSGIPLWFPHSFPQGLRLASILVHEISALLAIGALMIHVYMGVVVVVGSLGAMLRGSVPRSWVRTHHSRWLRGKDGVGPQADR